MNTTERDELFIKVGKAVTKADNCSIRFIRKTGGIGYTRALKIFHQLEAEYVVAELGSGRIVRMDSKEFKEKFITKKPKAVAAKQNNQLALKLDLHPQSLRALTLTALRDFRSSWIIIAKRLHEVATTEKFMEWDFPDFESYVKNELRMKPSTARKMIESRKYLIEHHPEVAEAPDGHIPDRVSVHLLSRLERSNHVKDEELKAVDAEVMAGDTDPSELKTKMNDMLAGARLPSMDNNREINDIRKASNALKNKIQGASVIPDGLRERLVDALLELNQLVYNA
jgi:hypothetical protein